RRSDRIGGTFGPKQPVARSFELIGLEIGDLAVDERFSDGRPQRKKFRVGDNGAAAEVVEVTKTEFQIMPKRPHVHALKMIDDLEHAYAAMTRNEGFKLLRRAIELLGGDTVGNFDLDRGEVVHLPVRQHVVARPEAVRLKR